MGEEGEKETGERTIVKSFSFSSSSGFPLIRATQWGSLSLSLSLSPTRHPYFQWRTTTVLMNPGIHPLVGTLNFGGRSMIDVAATMFDNRSHLDSRRRFPGELFTAVICTGWSHLPRVLISRWSRDGPPPFTVEDLLDKNWPFRANTAQWKLQWSQDWNIVWTFELSRASSF